MDAPDNPYLTRYEYGTAGQLTKVTYPSGVAKGLFYGAGGGLSMVKVDGVPTFAGMTSAANGATEAVNYGTATGSVSSVRVYDPTRLWPIEMKVGPGVVAGTGLQEANVLFGLSYGYEANGNVTAMNRYVQATPGAGQLLRACNYAYDALNRLSEFTYDQTNHYHYAMDEYGNLLAEQKVSGGTGAPKGMAMPVDAVTNRLAGKPYDSLGNQVTTVSGTATLNLAYWDQGHVSRVWGGGSGKTYHYYYDAEGKRRIKLVRSDANQSVLGWTVSCYEGEDLACEQDQGDRVQADAAYVSKFLLTDHLGTTRAELRIDAAGLPSVTQPTDTMPYGELIDLPSSSSDPVLFTGKQRDAESNLDFFGARFYSSTLGRWSSPDEPFADNNTANPQSWNLYSYVKNQATCLIDRTGRWSEKQHDRFIRKALSGRLTPDQIKKVVESNNNFDQQTQEKVHLHAMAVPGQNKYDVLQKMRAFREETISEIRKSREERKQNGDDRVWTEKELILFGELQHPTADATCPAHMGQGENFEPMV